MKKLVLTLGIALSAIVFVQAQESTTVNVENKTASVVKQMTANANLTSDEAAKITPFVKAFLQTRLDNSAKYSNDPAGMKQATETNREQLKTNLKTVLSQEKMNKLTAYYSAKQNSSYAPKSTK